VLRPYKEIAVRPFLTAASIQSDIGLMDIHLFTPRKIIDVGKCTIVISVMLRIILNEHVKASCYKGKK